MATYSAVKAPHASQSGIPIVADTSQLSKLARDLRLASPEAWKACRLALRAAAAPVAADARARASYSSRIPGSIKIRVGRGNVKIVAGGATAEDAAPLENKGRPGTFRHPVFGNRENWVDQPARPFLAPALAAHADRVAVEIEAAVYGAVERAVKGHF